MWIAIGKAAKIYGVSTSTLRRWEREGKMHPEFRTLGGHRRYNLNTLLGQVDPTLANLPINVVGYVRVSGHKQKKDLENQIKGINKYVKKCGWQLDKIYRDIASGLNDERPGFLRLLRDLPISQPYAVITTYKDRLARFGTKVVETFCNTFSSRLIAIHLPKIQTEETQMVDDVIALVTSFAGKIHRKRRGKVT